MNENVSNALEELQYITEYHQDRDHVKDIDMLLALIKLIEWFVNSVMIEDDK